LGRGLRVGKRGGEQQNKKNTKETFLSIDCDGLVPGKNGKGGRGGRFCSQADRQKRGFSKKKKSIFFRGGLLSGMGWNLKREGFCRGVRGAGSKGKVPPKKKKKKTCLGGFEKKKGKNFRSSPGDIVKLIFCLMDFSAKLQIRGGGVGGGLKKKNVWLGGNLGGNWGKFWGGKA